MTDDCSPARRHALAPDHPDAVIRALAARQHGVVSRRQLQRAGLPPHKIEYRLKRGILRALHRGVYRAGPVSGPREREMAAVLACGEAAVVSHRSAAALWRLIPAPPGRPPVDVIVQRGHRASSRGVRVHRRTELPADEITRLDALPITTPARTLVDLAGCVAGRDLERALAQADREGLADRERIQRILTRYPRSHGARRLTALLGATEGPALVLSEAETLFLELIRKARLRDPETNVFVQGYKVDCLWRAERLVVEVDGFAFHSSRNAFEEDRRRDSDLAAAGLRVMRVTWNTLTTEPEAVLVRVAQALAKTGRP